MPDFKPLTDEQLRSPAYSSTGTAMAAKGQYEACAGAENAIAEALDILVVLRKALGDDTGGLERVELSAVLTVVGIAEARTREARAEARRATGLTGWPGP